MGSTKETEYYKKKKTTCYEEADEIKKAEFKEEIEKLKKEKLVYVDESGINRILQREYAYSERGVRVHGKVKGKREKRISCIAAYKNKKLLAPMRFEGYTESNLFNQWLRESLIPELERGDTVILDNASFHKSPETRRLIEEAGCKLIYLPPYSPDLNPIEKIWSRLKKIIQYARQTFDDISSSIDYGFNVLSLA